MSTPQQDPKRRPGYYWVRFHHEVAIGQWTGSRWAVGDEDGSADYFKDADFEEIDERRIEHGDTQRIAELEAQVRKLESRLEERINQG